MRRSLPPLNPISQFAELEARNAAKKHTLAHQVLTEL
jgi:hypothetical protein